ncbi:MAG: DoxX family protein [Bacteroidia bacterium]
MTTTRKNTLIWILRLVAAIILLQTLFFKFSAAPVSVYIFTEVGIEPWGRIATGIIELIAAILILIPRTTPFGALLGLGLMSGALFFHFTTLGIVVQNDSGQLFWLAIAVFLSCAILLRIHWKQLKR